MKDYRVTVKVRNNRMLKAIEATGTIVGRKWCKANGLSYAKINDLINMTTSPLMEDGTLHPVAARLCELLNVIPDDLWSSEQLHPLERNFSSMEMSHEQVVAMLPAEQQSVMLDTSSFEEGQTRALLQKTIATLNAQEQEVIHLRFDEDLTLKEAGTRLGLSVERIRQIEHRALRKLRNPMRIDMFADILDIDRVERAKIKLNAIKYQQTHGAIL